MIRNLSKVNIWSLFVGAPELEGCITPNFLGFLYFFIITIFYMILNMLILKVESLALYIGLKGLTQPALAIYAEAVSYGHLILGANW